MKKKNKKKANTYGNSLKWKALLLIVGIVAIVGLTVMQHTQREKRNEKKAVAQEELQEKIQQETEKTEETESHGESVPESGTKKKQQGVSIINLDEYATRLMGDNTKLLKERLEEWVKDYQLNAEEGTIIHVMVPQSDPQSINFYIRLSDERASLVLLAYHPRENVVTASQCNYTEEEIANEVWEADNGPAVRDVSPEQDTPQQNVTEQGEVIPDTNQQEGAQTNDVTGQN